MLSDRMLVLGLGLFRDRIWSHQMLVLELGFFIFGFVIVGTVYLESERGCYWRGEILEFAKRVTPLEEWVDMRKMMM